MSATMLSTPNLGEYEQSGFAIVRSVVGMDDINLLRESIEALRQSPHSPGLRNLLSRCEAVRRLAISAALCDIAISILGKNARPVRAILFDKTPDSNWYGPWHQDLTIAVKQRREVDGYGPWSVREGVQQVQPPVNVLQGMVSLRVHLDPCTEENGALVFISGSHREGILDSDELASWRDNRPHALCPADIGDVIAMHPLILHSSSKSKSSDQRRVLAIEYGGVDLPGGLEWAEA
jgi:hypothetical protein